MPRMLLSSSHPESAARHKRESCALSALLPCPSTERKAKLTEMLLLEEAALKTPDSRVGTLPINMLWIKSKY